MQRKGFEDFSFEPERVVFAELLSQAALHFKIWDATLPRLDAIFEHFMHPLRVHCSTDHDCPKFDITILSKTVPSL